MSLFGSLFKTQKTPSYAGARPPAGLSDVEGGRDYYKNITDRLAGRGVGYGEDYTSNANPQMAQLRNQFSGYTMPELNSELSLSGRRKGSSGFQQISRAYGDEADKENSIMAQLMQRNAEASHNDVNDAFSKQGQYAETNANLAGNYANFDRGLYQDQSKNIQADNKYNQDLAMNDLNYGTQAIGAMFGVPSIPGMSSSPPINYGGATYSTSQPPPGYNMNNIQSRLVSRQGQRGRAY